MNGTSKVKNISSRAGNLPNASGFAIAGERKQDRCNNQSPAEREH